MWTCLLHTAFLWGSKQKTPKNGQMVTVRVKMSERVKWKISQKLLCHAHFRWPSENFVSHEKWVSRVCCRPTLWQMGQSFDPKRSHSNIKRLNPWIINICWIAPMPMIRGRHWDIGWIGWLANVPIFGRVEWEERICMKVKVLSFKLFLLFSIVVNAW